MKPKADRAKLIELAQKHQRAGRLAEAIAEYRKLVEGEAPDPSILNIMGDFYLRLGETQEAILCFQQAVDYFETRGSLNQALAFLRKITKVAPEEPAFMAKMGDLLSRQGFTAEAEKEYLMAIDIWRKQNNLEEIIRVYEKLISLNKENVDYKISLAELYVHQGQKREALVQFNEAAELLLNREEMEKARFLLERAHEVDPLDERTIGNLVQLLKRTGLVHEAMRLLQEAKEKAPQNITFRYLLGTIYLEKKLLAEARSIFEDILAEKPVDVKARVQLGKIYVLEEKLDQAFELYEPLINSLLKKKKDDKAIGLLGLILAKGMHFPSLEKLASIYKARGEKESLEVVLRSILEEARQKKRKEKMLAVLAELVEIVPRDEEIIREYWSLRRELSPAEGAAAAEGEEEIEELLARADIYIHQGLYRNARRILENLALQHPEDERVRQRIEFIDRAKIEVPEEELVLRVEKISAIETEIEKRPGGARSFLSFLRETGALDEKVTSAEIFHGTDLLPLSLTQPKEAKYCDLQDKVKEEIEALKEAVIAQLKRGLGAEERELMEILDEFKRQAKSKLGLEDYETHFQLGLAFLEQGLYEEAIEEFMISAQSTEKALESCTLVAEGFRRKKDYSEAIRWLEKALELCSTDPEKYYSLEYEIASLYEKLHDQKRALSFYQKILSWNASFRDVAKKVAALQGAS